MKIDSSSPINISRPSDHESISIDSSAQEAALSAIASAGRTFSEAHTVIREDGEAFQKLGRYAESAIKKVERIQQATEETIATLEKLLEKDKATLQEHSAKMVILQKRSDALTQETRKLCKESDTFWRDLRKNAYICAAILFAILAITMIPFRSLLARLR